ncbi:MAG: class probable F420-dependent enzyme Rv2061 family [Acidobacteriaceae bacterium]|nr:class probable F420-dependent enzyme Rv2061 family [Acidobacteriaceae bacterium]
MAIPKEIQGQKYICLITFRKSGVPVNTPVWFAELDAKLIVKTRIDSGKSKRIRNNPNVKLLLARCEAKSSARNLPARRGFFLRNNGRAHKKL